MIFDNWSGLVRVLGQGVGAYAVLILLLRLSGKRTLSKMNAFDLVVTVALGSTLATVLLSKDVALAEGVAAFAVLILSQYAIAALSVRSGAVEAMAKSNPSLLLRDGMVDDAALVSERVTGEEVCAAVRAAGLGDLALVAAVVLESDGSLSVIAKAQKGDGSALPHLGSRPS